MWIFYTLVAVFCWALLNVIDSMLVENYEAQPRVISWHQSSFSMPILLVLYLALQPAWSPWVLLFLVIGFVANMGDLAFWYALGRIDVSVTNFVWGFMAILLSIAGFTVFQER